MAHAQAREGGLAASQGEEPGAPTTLRALVLLKALDFEGPFSVEATGGMAESASHLSDQLLAGGTALAGLILVFLGITLTSYEAYDAPQQGSVRYKYQRRAVIAFLGFACSLVAAASAVAATLGASSCWEMTGLTSLGLALFLTGVLAAVVVADFWQWR